MRTTLVLLCCLGLLVACGESKRDVKDTVFAPQVRALEKARSVEDKLKQGMEKNRETLKESENQDSDAARKPAGY